MPNVDYARHTPILGLAISVAAGLLVLPPSGVAQIGYQSIGGVDGTNFGGSSMQPPAPHFARPAFRHPHYATRPYRHHEVRERDEPSEGRRVVSSDKSSPRPAVCVRLCDGRYFPLPRSTTDQANALCVAACPKAAVSVFRADGDLKDATDANGKTYSALPNAFAYRSRAVPDCSCRGEHKPGMASVAVEKDPTLEQGDIVVTQHGRLLFQGKSGDDQHAFTPVEK
jgi:hypothetical protein